VLDLLGTLGENGGQEAQHTEGQTARSRQVSVSPLSSSQGIIRFGNFDVDLRSGELRKRGARIKLQIQPFQVLQILLQLGR